MNELADKFKKSTIEIISKRAANTCSNPECKAITSGPASEEERSVTVGEAAHVYGARPSSARHDPDMSPADRGAITNAIWLCRNCHKIVDADPTMYPAAMLFAWRNNHEKFLIDRIGKAEDQIRRQIVEKELQEFSDETDLARQIIIDKPYAWEYLLTAELLRSKIKPILKRVISLERGLYAKPLRLIPRSRIYGWFQERTAELAALAPALSGIINHEIMDAWGPPGVPGLPESILSACNLFEEACRNILEWEENVRFSLMPSEFEELQHLLKGVGSRLVQQVATIPDRISDVFSDIEVPNDIHINVMIDLPDGWSEEFSSELARISGSFEFE